MNDQEKQHIMSDRANQKPLFILEMANNHGGSVAHGIRIVEAMKDAVRGFDQFEFAIKLQYRDIDTFIHPDYKNRRDLKFVKRFSETKLEWDEYKNIKDAIVAHGFRAICTPWDELSVQMIEDHGYDFIKIPSCYWSDWPLIERIGASHLPVIGSVAGVGLQDIDSVVSFFRHRERPLSLMHCVGEYVTHDDHLQLNQIALLRNRYPDLAVGYSTHERPENADAVMIAIGLGATLFEKHVGVPTADAPLNAYSANPEQVTKWLQAAARAHAMCGISGERMPFSREETQTLGALRRAVFAKAHIPIGHKIRPEDIFVALPGTDGQLVANNLSKYSNYYALSPIEPGQPVMGVNVKCCDSRKQVHKIISDVKKLLKKSRVIVPGQTDLEISHHYGIDNFAESGSTVITVVNREYCKRIIVMLPGQMHPEQYHLQKDETYHILYGDIELALDGHETVRKANDVVVIPRGVRHGFKARNGAVIEEVSSYYTQNDSYYTDDIINQNQNRKTYVTHWME